MTNFIDVVRLGSDSELRFTEKGDAVLQFNAAYDTGYGDRKKTTWVRCQLWGKRANTLEQYLKKGTQVQLQGDIYLNEYTSKDGQKKSSLECNVSDIKLLGKPEGQPTSAPSKPAGTDTFSDFESEIPF
jgi:single-strand DNA-binding protein